MGKKEFGGLSSCMECGNKLTPAEVQGLVQALEYINGLALANEPRDLKTIAQTSAKALQAYKEAQK